MARSAVKNATYKARLSALTNFVLVRSHTDTIILPPESAWFGFFKENSTRATEPLQDTPLWREDWLGLRSLHEAGRLHFAECACKHVQVPTRRCRVAVWEQGTRRFLQPAGVRGWLRALLEFPKRDAADDDADDDTDYGSAHSGGGPRVRDMDDVFREAAAAFTAEAGAELRRSNARLARGLRKLSESF